jgi:acyl-CoA synthetase (AMP-forming)/AMP-acid ligase II
MNLFTAMTAGGSASSTALIRPDGTPVTYAQLPPLTDQWCRVMQRAGKSLVVCFAGRNLATVLCYLAALRLGHAVALLDAGLDPRDCDRFLTAYQPEFVVWCPDNGTSRRSPPSLYRHTADVGGAAIWSRITAPDGPLHGDLALVLSTSGSTGSPKAARLSYAGLASNSRAISESLGVTDAERGITALPLHFAYGLMMLSSHLLSGAGVACCEQPPTSRAFWRYFSESRCTNFAGVDSTYDTLWRVLGMFDLVPTLRVMTQGGQRLRDELVLGYAALMERRKGRFFVTYGQTEATGRISSLDVIRWPERVGSVGTVIPGGRLAIAGNEGSTQDPMVGKIIYSGPNVMLGYAERRADLATGDVMGGTLGTGDVGYLDGEFLYLTGRQKRIAKVLGRRLSLDDIERLFADVGVAVAVDRGDRGLLLLTEEPPAGFEKACPRVAARVGIPVTLLAVRRVDRFPRTRTGKIDYTRLPSF